MSPFSAIIKELVCSLSSVPSSRSLYAPFHQCHHRGACMLPFISAIIEELVCYRLIGPLTFWVESSLEDNRSLERVRIC